MPLVDTLQAMRGLILDADSVPSDVAERRKLILGYAPGLLKEELEDMLAMPPERLKVYTNTVFSGEAKVLKNHFKITLALLDRYASDFSLFQTVRNVHAKYPWRGNQSQALAENLFKYLRDLEVADCPYLQDVAMLELSNIQIKREFGPMIKPNLEQLASCTVESLLQSQYKLASSAILAEFNHDVVSFYQQFYMENQLPKNCNDIQVCAVGARNYLGRPLWTKLSAEVAKFLKNKPEFELITLAEVFTHELPDDISEEDAFGQFFSFFKSLLSNGVFNLN